MEVLNHLEDKIKIVIIRDFISSITDKIAIKFWNWALSREKDSDTIIHILEELIEEIKIGKFEKNYLRNVYVRIVDGLIENVNATIMGCWAQNGIFIYPGLAEIIRKVGDDFSEESFYIEKHCHMKSTALFRCASLETDDIKYFNKEMKKADYSMMSPLFVNSKTYLRSPRLKPSVALPAIIMRYLNLDEYLLSNPDSINSYVEKLEMRENVHIEELVRNGKKPCVATLDLNL